MAVIWTEHVADQQYVTVTCHHGTFVAALQMVKLSDHLTLKAARALRLLPIPYPARNLRPEDINYSPIQLRVAWTGWKADSRQTSRKILTMCVCACVEFEGPPWLSQQLQSAAHPQTAFR